MKEIRIKTYIRYLFGMAILVFFMNKFYLRPWVLKHELSEFFQIIVWSIPNLIEAMVGTLVLTGILMQLRAYFINKLGDIKNTYIHLIAVGLAGIFVLLQEYKFHNFGGNNVYDIYDVIASIIGLALTFALLQFFGFAEESETEISSP